MKNVIMAITTLLALNVSAAVETANVRVTNGVMPNPVLAPMGQLVNVENGEVLYVNAVISVLAPSELKADCIYQISFTRDSKIAARIRLVPPMTEISCGHDLSKDK